MRFTSFAGSFEVESAPAQPQLAHCHSFFVPRQKRGQGQGHELKSQQNRYLAAMQYDYALCTVAGDNAAQKRVLEKAGWRKLDEFTSSKTGAPVELWGYAVRGPES